MPKLRFPEFEQSWEEIPLGELGQFFRGLTYGADDVASEGLLVLRSSNIQGGQLVLDSDLVFVTKRCPPEMCLKRGDIAICMSNGSKALVGKSGEFHNDYPGELTVGAFCSIFRPKKPFAKIAFSTPRYENFVATGIAGGNINNLKNSDLESFVFHVPPTNEEQQKIADCLSSLDELIAAQARKVDALKTQKKGLMQQLFPREDETQPRLRFPEFRDADDWVSSTLGAVFDTTSGGTPSRAERDYWDGDIPWITTSLVNFGVITEAEEYISQAGLKNSSAKLLPKGAVLIAMYGQGKTRGQVALLGVEATTNQACAAVLPKEGINPYFVFSNLAGRYEEFRKLSNSGGQENLSQALVRDFPFAYPADEMEQQRVTDCLTSLDTLITGATQELETLKTHKKGLMQQLFPSVEAIEA